MKIFVSSTSRDLAEYRAAAIRGLRRLGHTVVAMEDFTAARAAPLDRVLQLVRSCDAYVVIVAWRYGFAPADPAGDLPERPGNRTELSITEWEYLAAREDPNRLVLPFLLAETAPWPPQEMDGFQPGEPGDAGSLARVRAFRATLMQDHVDSFFTRPDELEALVGAAVTAERISRGVVLNRTGVGNPVQGGTTTPDSDYSGGLLRVVREIGSDQVVTIDIADDGWWSTRLYLLAFLLNRLTRAQRILVVDDGEFVGMLPLGAVLRVMTAKHDQLRAFDLQDRTRTTVEPDVVREAQALVDLFGTCFATHPRTTTKAARAAGPLDSRLAEEAAKLDVSRANLARWFDESIITNPIRIDSLERALPVDLIRIFDYPNDFVPVIVGHGDQTTEQQRSHVIVKPALSLQLARTYVTDLLDESR
jgi:hypothetical protein